MSDLISRQAAVDALAKFVPYAICDESTESYTNGLMDAYNLICQLPSAEPEQKIGKWIKMSDADGEYYCCSECGEELYREWSFDRNYDLFPSKKSIDKTKYCPNCGIKMEEQDG